ncbi:MAG: hypothetical protein NZL95_03955 [Chitinophagales bacterium]|nr:hypothetical protein [Chitinophagales bacterium]MDW8427685.1 hypothetical protein [Chitinophagales bacterium]
MSVLRFRIMYEEDDTIYREVEILSSQTLQKFVESVRSSFGLAPQLAAELYTGNDAWHKVHHLPLTGSLPAGGSGAQGVLGAQPLIKFIFDPHQRFIFEINDTSEQLLIELYSISDAVRSDVSYPVLVRSNGASPFRKEEPAVAGIPAGPAPSTKGNQKEEEEDEEVEDADYEGPDDFEEEIMLEEEADELPSGDLMEGDAMEEPEEEEGSADLGLDEEFFDDSFDDDLNEDDFEDDFR